MEEQSECELPPISSVSPSLAETLRNCPLQAGISRIRAVRNYVLGNPKAWLGAAYHAVLERMWTAGTSGGGGRFDELWRNSVSNLQTQAIAHPLNKRFADPERWPGYHLVRALAVLRAQEALRSQNPEQVATGSPTRVIREKEFRAMDEKLVGKPDVIIGNEIRDYKSGSIYEDSSNGKQSVKETYIRQLRLYGRLVQENFGVCPTKGVLLPMQGAAVEIDLEPQACASAAEEAVGLLDKYNVGLRTVQTISDLATPSPRACRWCQFKGICPAFWKNVTEKWTENLGSACVRGTLECSPMHIHNEKAFALTMTNTTGSTAAPVTIAPLECTVHSNIAPWQSGDVVRVINLYRRNDGQLAPTSATVCLRERDCPTLALPAVGVRA